MNEEEEDKFLKENPVVFKKYQVKKKLGEGAFGEVYLGQAIENKAYVALKVEPRKIAKPILQSEAFLLYSIAGPGIPAVKSFGKVKNYNVLVEPLLGKSLFDIFAENHKEMPIEDICLIGKQVIDRIQWIHSKFIVHRDIKPDNFLIGKDDPNVIYLIDFGLSKKYRSSNSGKHIRFGFTGKLTGTVRFASANALRGGEQSRRDDIESIGYMIVYFMKKRLPWQGVTGTRKMERYLKIYKLKKNTSPEDLCEGLPPEMVEYMTYAKKLEFEQEPNYNYLRKLFSKMLKRFHTTNDQLVFSWIKLKDLPKLKNPVNPSSRRESPQSRIYRKIKSSLERERNLSSDSNDSKHSYQQVYSQAKAPNLKVIDKSDFPESELDQKKEKKINKRALKAREELNTMIANLDTFVDENAVDFDNEKLIGSKDFGEITSNKNLFDNIKSNNNKDNINYNNNNENIKNNDNNKNDNEKQINYINFDKEINNDLFDNNETKVSSAKTDLINKNKNIINNYLDNLAVNENNMTDVNKIKSIKDLKDFSEIKERKESLEKQLSNNNDINDLNQQNNNENIVDNLNPLGQKNNQINNDKNVMAPPFDSINNMIFQKADIQNYLNANNNKLNAINEYDDNNINDLLNNDINKPNENKENNEEKKIPLKISNLEGREFTFNESLNFRPNFKFDREVKNVIPESKENILSEDKKDNTYSFLQINNKTQNKMNSDKNANNNINLPNNSGNNKIKLIKNNMINKNNSPKVLKIKNNINNAINKNKLNKNIQINKKNQQRPKEISNINNNSKDKVSKEQNIGDIKNINFPSDNNSNNFEFLDNEHKIKKIQNQTPHSDIYNFNNNVKRIKKVNINNNKIHRNKIVNNISNNLPNVHNLTLENKANLIPNDAMIDAGNINRTAEFEAINNQMMQNNNKQRKDNLNIMPNNKNNLGNNITNININIKNNYVQNNDKNNKNMKVMNMNIKKYPKISKNYTDYNLNNNLNNNNLMKNKIRISPRNQNQKQIINPNMRSIYPNNQRIIQNYPPNLQKNNVNIMINNPNNINIKKLNNNMIMNKIIPNQIQTNPNTFHAYPNSVKSTYPAQIVFTGGNPQNMNVPKRMTLLNPNVNYGLVMQPKMQVNNYPNINQNIGLRYNNATNNFNNMQNMQINTGNYPMYKY